MLWDYAYAAGPAVTSGPLWPAEAGLSRDTTRPTLVLFLHPQCVCSRATLYELEQVLSSVARRPAIYALIYRPASEPESWAHTDLWMAADAIDGIDVRPDVDGRVAAGFGAKVSGTALLFAPDGGRLFDGGLTGARGHVGPNPGASALAHLLTGDAATPIASRVFGCLLGTIANEAAE